MPALRGVAQSVEHRSPKPRVVGSKSYRPCQHAGRRLRSAARLDRRARRDRRRTLATRPRSRSRWRSARLDRLGPLRREMEDQRHHRRARGSCRAAAPWRACRRRRPSGARGAAASIVRLFGAWKKPKPKPQSAIIATMPSAVDVRRQPAEEREPDREQRPCRRRRGCRRGCRSESRPASGAARPSATGQGVISSPVCDLVAAEHRTGSRRAAPRRRWRRRQRRRSRRSPRARRPGSRKRSIGMSGAGSRAPRRTSTTPGADGDGEPDRGRQRRPAPRVSASAPTKKRPNIAALRSALVQSNGRCGGLGARQVAPRQPEVQEAEGHVDREEPGPGPDREDARGERRARPPRRSRPRGRSARGRGRGGHRDRCGGPARRSCS